MRRSSGSTPHGPSRGRKADFTPLELRPLWIEDLADTDAAIPDGWFFQHLRSMSGGVVARDGKTEARFADAGRWQVAHRAGGPWPCWAAHARLHGASPLRSTLIRGKLQQVFDRMKMG